MLTEVPLEALGSGYHSVVYIYIIRNGNIHIKIHLTYVFFTRFKVNL